MHYYTGTFPKILKKEKHLSSSVEPNVELQHQKKKRKNNSTTTPKKIESLLTFKLGLLWYKLYVVQIFMILLKK